jgi:asparagine synthetase B (glutamine-hydrolysing)
LGRRSLLVKEGPEEGGLRVASVGVGEGWREVDAGGVWRVGLRDRKREWVTRTQQGDLVSSSLSSGVKDWELTKNQIYKVPTMNTALPSPSHYLSITSPEVSQLKQVLTESISLRVRDIPEPPSPAGEKPVRLAILFSGGLDCTMLARIVHEVFPTDEAVDLLNVAFENPRVVAAAAKPKPTKKSKQKPNGPLPPSVQNGDTNSNHLNLATTEPTTNVPKQPETTEPYSLCPDRQTGLASYHELRSVCPSRQWNFVAINIPYSEVMSHKPTIIKLMAPHNTEMDLSIAMAFYFAARGQTSDSPTPYTTPARILLSGLGADELLAGYTRHATAFFRSGYEGLVSELQLDFERLGKRNLGRDDRVLADWAREARYPFLDQKVVEWALGTPVYGKCGFGESGGSRGEEEKGKKVLRLLAEEMGMAGVAKEKKRAVQFGSRSAKMGLEAGRKKGTDGV